MQRADNNGNNGYINLRTALPNGGRLDVRIGEELHTEVQELTDVLIWIQI